MANISLKNIVKKFKKFRALDDIDLDIKEKEFFVIFGPAGAGKTTLLNVISGVHIPDSGQVLFDKKIMNFVEPNNRNVAMVFENYALYPHISVFDNIASPLRSPKYRQSEQNIKERVTKVAKTLNIDLLLNRRPSELSNGQRQRVALGRALVRQPEVYLMDEPLTHLDAKLRNQMRAELKEMQQNNPTTTLYVTHDYLEALSLADRIAVLNQGKIEQIGTPSDIYYRPASEFVAESFGEPEINLFDASIAENKGENVLNIIGWPNPLMIPKNVRQVLVKGKYRSVRVGVRPTNIHYSFSSEDRESVQATVYSFEPLGTKAILIVAINQHLISMVASSDLEIKIGQTIYVKIDVDKAIYFDAEKRTLITGDFKEGRG